MEKNKPLNKVMPVLLAFFVMSFCDLVGIGVDRVKSDFNLSNTLAQLIPSAVFLWFFLLSVPVGILQDRIGKKIMVNIGMLVTALGLLIPGLGHLIPALYTFPFVLVGFALLGIGNTIMQVSANPLLVDVVPGDRKASYLSFSQFIKAIGSMVAAPLAGWFASAWGDWKILFIVFGMVSILSILWLSALKIEESRNQSARASFGSSLSLLGNRFVALMVLGIFLVVGIDVGINAVSGQFMLSKFQSAQTLAESGRSVYFFGKMLGTFAGALLLTRLASRKFFFWSAILSVLTILALLVAPSEYLALGIIFVIGLGVSNIFPLIFTLSVEKYPERANEISGLMIMAVSGGALVPLVIGWLTDNHGLVAGMSVLLACAIYLLWLSAVSLRK